MSHKSCEINKTTAYTLPLVISKSTLMMLAAEISKLNIAIKDTYYVASLYYVLISIDTIWWYNPKLLIIYYYKLKLNL